MQHIVIASEAKQSVLIDCFVASLLAMTFLKMVAALFCALFPGKHEYFAGGQEAAQTQAVAV